MKIHIQKIHHRLDEGAPPPERGLCRTYEVNYDPSAADRALYLTDDLLRYNYAPGTIVAGLRAYLSLYVRSLRQDLNHKNSTELVILANGGKGTSFTFDGFKVELDMDTEDVNAIRVTCGMAGVAKLLERTAFESPQDEGV